MVGVVLGSVFFATSELTVDIGDCSDVEDGGVIPPTASVALADCAVARLYFFCALMVLVNEDVARTKSDNAVLKKCFMAEAVPLSLSLSLCQAGVKNGKHSNIACF